MKRSGAVVARREKRGARPRALPIISPFVTAMGERIVAACHPLQVILFGSHARGEAGPRSDVDFLVVMPDGVDKRQARGVIHDALSDSETPKDIVVATPEEIARRGDMVGNVLRPALREGRLLYDATGLVVAERPHGEPILEVHAVTEEDRMVEARLWLRLARTDLAQAELTLANPDMDPEPACYHAQQAAEKSLKAVLVYLQIQYPFAHDLDAIRGRIPAGWRVADEHPGLKWLSEFSYKARYPGEWAQPTVEDARAGIAEARAIYEGVLRDLLGHGFTL